MSLQPFTPAEAVLGVEHPRAARRFTILPSRQHLTLRLVLRPIEIIDSIGLVEVSVRARRSARRGRRTVNISSRPSRKLAAASGQRSSRLRGSVSGAPKLPARKTPLKAVHLRRRRYLAPHPCRSGALEPLHLFLVDW